MLDSIFILLGLAQEPAVMPAPNLIDFSPAPQLIAPSPAPVINAKAAIVFDLGSGKVLYEKNADKRLPIASLTKLMTVVVARENFSLDEVVTISENAANQPPAKIWLKPGEKISVEDLIKTALIRSGNDATVALAEHSNDLENFVAQMNEKAITLGLQNTHFTNPVGYDDPKNYSTVYDLALLASYVLRDPLLKNIAAQNRETIFSTENRAYHLASTNVLFGSYLDIRGLKTGSTEEAGACFAAMAKSEDARETLAIVLDSPNRFQEAKVMLEWAESNFRF